MNASQTHDLDYLIYGATGYVGQRVTRLLMEQCPKARVGIAGRNPKKLEAVQAKVGDNAVVIVADSAQPTTVDAAVARAPVVLACAGPFAQFGTPVVEACVKKRTHYVDITGETPWVHGLIKAHHEEAKANGTFIVPFSGYDSIPSDLGTWLCVRRLREEHGQKTKRISNTMFASGGLNGGTAQSAFDMYGDKAASAIYEDPFALCPDFEISAKQRERAADRPGSQIDLDGQRRAPFFMAKINSRVVLRSAELFAQAGQEQEYGPLHYQELFDLGRSGATLKAYFASGMMRGLEGALRFGPSRALMKALAPKGGKGPSEATIAGGFARTMIVAEGEGGARVRVVMKSKGDPGNAVTSLLLIAAARVLGEDAAAIGTGQPGRGGLLTPAFAFGDHLLKRLRESGIEIAVKSDSTTG